nr:ATP synthase F0 subunit 8 [Moechotypa diphysis]
MPQMMPLSWIILFILFIFVFLLFNIYNYSNFSYQQKISMFYKKPILFNWKW